MAAPDFSVTDVVGRGVNFAKANWRRVLGVLLLATVTAALSAGYGYAGRDGPAGVLSLVNGLVTFMATAALLRLAFQQDQPGRPDFQIGRQGVQWGNPETQLLLVALLLIFWAILAASAVVFVIFLLALFLGLSGAMSGLSASTPEALASQLGPGLTMGLGLFLIALGVGLIWLSVRLALYAPATVAAGRVRLFSTLPPHQGPVLEAARRAAAGVAPDHPGRRRRRRRGGDARHAVARRREHQAAGPAGRAAARPLHGDGGVAGAAAAHHRRLRGALPPARPRGAARA
jgi:hypothetical protein